MKQGGLMSRKSIVLSWMATARSQILSDCRGAQLVEFAIGLPILLVMAVAVSQFSGSFNLKQILNNAAREGARTAAGEFADFGTLNNCGNGSCVAAAAESVSNYLQKAGVNPQCTFSTAGTSVGSFAWQFTASGTGCAGASLKIEQRVPIGTGPTIGVARVTLTYPNPYTMGGLLSFLVPGNTTVLPVTLTTNAIMPNLST